ncbi:MarR family winged helix-turn-helix transcriptional regulator [Kordiimonas pumila]|uniref:MarR family winged helix-turn-helix transcriptional regulator n=1 Tax=Kordiimonas pumila TaxID=2161677 RepID=A0ABV7D318_9PROT|nr:MarR family transcriptional regulator [Kordiimonas pumila]
MSKYSSKAISTWHQLLQCYKSMERNIGGQLQNKHSQSLSRFDVLSQLCQASEDWLQVGELTRRLLDTAGSVSALLTRMEKEGLIERRLNPDDRRSFQVTVTAKGRSLHKEMASDYAKWVASAMEDISDQEREVLMGLLNRLSRAQKGSATGEISG